MSRYDYSFDPATPNNTAATVYAVARRGGPRVLDLGCGPAIVGRALASVDGYSVTCLDVDEEGLAEAAAGGVSAVHVVDLEEPSWSMVLDGGRYDTVILADVLEHLRRPETLLGQIHGSNVLTDDAQLIVSFPNANHQAVLAELITGHFSYTETGLLDRTHLRWFTLDSMSVMLEAAGFVVTEVHRTLRDLEQTSSAVRAAQLSTAATEVIAQLGVEGRTYQYVLQVRRAGEAARLTQLTQQLDASAAELATERRRLRAVEQRLAAVQQLVREERGERDEQLRAGAEQLAALREDLAAAQRRADEQAAQASASPPGDRVAGEDRALRQVRGKLARTRAEVDAARARLQRIEGSRSYRLARRLDRAARPLRTVRRALRRSPRQARTGV